MEVLLVGQIPRWGGSEQKRRRRWRRPHRCAELVRPQREAGQGCCPPACANPSPGVGDSPPPHRLIGSGDSPNPGAFPSSVPSLPTRGLREAFRMQWGRRDGSGVAHPSPRVVPSHNPQHNTRHSGCRPGQHEAKPLQPPWPPSPQAGGSPASHKPIPEKGTPILLWGHVGPASSLRIWAPSSLWGVKQKLPDGIAGVGAQPRGARGPSSPRCPQGDPRDKGAWGPATGSPRGRSA